MNVQETSTGVAQLLRTLPFRELVTFADAMRACANRGADALTCAEAIDAWARGDTDQVDQKYEEDDDVCTRDGAEQREHGTQGGDRGDRGEGRERPDGSTGDRASAHGRDDGERAPGLHGSTGGARPAEGGLARLDGTSAASASAADTGSGADASEGQRHDGRDARHDGASPNSPAGDDKPAGASFHTDTDETADLPAGGQLTGNEEAVLRAILALQGDSANITYSTIAERSGVTKTSIGWFAGSLERKGWIRRSGPAGDRRYEVLAHPDGKALPQPPKASQPTAKPEPHPTGADPTDQARKSLKAATQQGKCAVCRSQPAEDGSDLCADCEQLAHREPGVGEGPLPHYDERKRQEAAEDVRRRHQSIKSRQEKCTVKERV